MTQGPVSCSKGHSSFDLPGKGHSTLGHSTHTRLGKGHSTHQLPGQGYSTLGQTTRALLGKGQELQGKDHSTLGHSTRTRLSKGHSTHQLPGQDHSTLGHSTSALPVHGPTDRACQYFRRHREKKATHPTCRSRGSSLVSHYRDGRAQFRFSAH